MARRSAHPAYRTPAYRAAKRWLKQREGGVGGPPIRCSLDGPHCTGVATTPHHIVPVLAGGSWGPDNLTPVCMTCNLWIARKRRRTDPYLR